MSTVVEETFEQTLSIGGPVHLDVGSHAGVIRIRHGDPGIVRIRGTLRPRAYPSIPGGAIERIWSMFDDPAERIRQLAAKPPIEQNGDRIRAGDVSDRWLLRGILLLLEITVPAETQVRALADSGNIAIEDIAGPIECETDSGRIEISGIAGAVRASSDSGAIYLRRITGGVRMETDSGAVEALELGSTATIATDSGAVRVSQIAPAPMRIETDSGRIIVKLAPGAGYCIDAESDSGRIITPSVFPDRTSRHRAAGRIAQGGPNVEIKSDSGSIEIE